MEITIVTNDGCSMSPLDVTELENGLFRLENAGGFMADEFDFGDTLRLEHIGGSEYLLKERTPSNHRRFDIFIRPETDLSRTELVAYLDRVLYWEHAYGGWLCMFIENHSNLQPDEEFMPLLQQQAS